MIGGTVHINEYVICHWRARRIDPHHGNEPDAVNIYRCHAVYDHIDGYTHAADFDIEHRFGDGALLLAAAVLRAIPEELKRVYGDAKTNAMARAMGESCSR